MTDSGLTADSGRPFDTQLRLGVTGPRRQRDGDEALAEAAARELSVPYEPRLNRSFDKMIRALDVDALMIVSEVRRTIRLASGGNPLDFHCNTGVLRVRLTKHGAIDPLIRALEVGPGDTVIDATAGQCADALVIAHAVCPTGKVIALESSTALFGLISWGVREWRRNEKKVDESLDCMEVRWAHYLDELRRLPAKSVDAVYFDPMFKTPAKSNGPFETLRQLADPRPLTRDALDEACRVARNRVVVKDRRDAQTLHEFGLRIFEGVRSNSPIRYGIIDL